MNGNGSCENPVSIRPFEAGDETELAELVVRTLQVSNSKDYSPEYIEDIIREHTPGFFVRQAEESHFYVACNHGRIVGCGAITGYRGSMTESYLQTIFVLPEYQGRGVGRRIMETLEQDEYFRRAWRTELASSITAVGFYRKLGYDFKGGIAAPDEHLVIRMEKRNADVCPYCGPTD